MSIPSPLHPSSRLNMGPIQPSNKHGKMPVRRKLGSRSFGKLEEISLAEEKQELKRRRSSILSQAVHDFESPQKAGEQPLRKQDSASGMSNQELAMHYKDCIRQYTENKISMKNAFSLKLLDVLPDCIRLDNNNFQTAGTALDASARIYSYRVDLVHEDAFKIVGGLGRTSTKKGGAKDGEDPESELSPQKKKRRRPRAHTVVEDTKTINLPSKDIQCEDDSLFRHACSQFDEGGLSGLLLNNIHSMGCGMPLLLHCLPHKETKKNSSTQDMPLFQETELEKTVLEKAKSILDEKMCLCPSLSGFQFRNWVADVNSDPMETNETEDTLRFRAHLLPEISNEDDNLMEDMDLSGLEPEAPEEWEENAITRLGIVPATKNQEYSYFDQTRLETYKGPKHWKIKPDEKGAVKRKRQPAKRKKQEPMAEFDVDKELEKIKNVDPINSVLTETTLTRYEKESCTTLDPELDYKAESLIKLGLKDVQVGSLLSGASPEPMNYSGLEEEADEDDVYRDAHSQQFVPDPSNCDQPTFAPGFDLTAYQPAIASPMPGPADSAPSPERILLIQKPCGIPKITINYDKRLRRIDARAVKSATWNILVDKEKEKLGNAAVKMPEKRIVKFSELWHKLPALLKSGFKEDLRPADALNFLLHLANEKNLHLVGNELLNDFTITQSLTEPQESEENQ